MRHAASIMLSGTVNGLKDCLARRYTDSTRSRDLEFLFAMPRMRIPYGLSEINDTFCSQIA